MKIQVQQNIEYPSKDFDGRDFLETTYAVSLCDQFDEYFYFNETKFYAEAKFNFERIV